jgi:CDP-diglyceride synthetase
MPHAGSVIPFTKLFKLTIAGGLAFWVTSVATSLLPIAAEYRAALSNWSPQAVWVGSVIAGMMIACGVSYFSVRSMGKTPKGAPLLTAVNWSLVALVIATILLDVPRSIHGPSDALYYFLIGLVFNAVRFLVLGMVIGSVLKRQYGAARPSGYSPVKGDTK